MIEAKKYMTIAEIFKNSLGGETMGYYGNAGRAPTSKYVTRQPYYKQTPKYYVDKKEEIANQRELFKLEEELERQLAELRDDIGAYMAGRITLGALLDELLDSSTLCNRIGVWSN